MPLEKLINFEYSISENKIFLKIFLFSFLRSWSLEKNIDHGHITLGRAIMQ
jgi:hypothetical protein